MDTLKSEMALPVLFREMPDASYAKVLVAVDHTQATAYTEVKATVGNYSYYGRTPASGTRSTSAAIWQIWRTKTDETETAWADGDARFDNVWDNIATLSYAGAVA